MGFLSGGLTFERYRITQDSTPELGSEHLEILERFQIGAFKTDSLDQPNVGFLAGSHLLDTKFDLAKNVIGDAMHFGVRIDTNQIPGPVRNAWLQMELLPLIADNPSGRPTKAQREEAKEAVEARCIQEAASEKFRRMQQVPVLWDSEAEVMYIGGTSSTSNELVIDLLERSFELEFERMSAGSMARAFAEESNLMAELFKAGPTAFHGDAEVASITWWNGMADNFDYMGNEFLLWLWWYFETESDTIKLSDDSEVSGMFARTLTLDCPLGESGKETISADSPVALPETVLAIQSGKLPRKAGLTLVRNGEQYDFALQAEAFTVGGGKISQIGKASPSENPTEDRIASVRALSDTLDLLFDVFCERRIGKAWKGEVKKMRSWLKSESVRSLRNPAA